MVSSIYESQERCRSSFEGLIDILKNPARDYGDQIPPKGVANEFSRFKVWAGSLGARQNPQRRISLDYRLRDSTYYRDRVVEFLDDLHASLQKATLLLQDRRQPFEEVPSPTESESDEEPVPPLGAQRSPQSPEPSALDRLRAIVSEHGDAQDSQVSTLANADLPSRTPTMEMPLVYDSIRNIIEHLYTLSMAIRRPIPTDRLAKLARFPVPYYVPYDEAHVKECFPNASPDLQSRLASAITRRRQVLLYNNYRHIQRSLEPLEEVTSRAKEVETGHAALDQIDRGREGLGSEIVPRTQRSRFAESHQVQSTEASKFVPPEEGQRDTQSEAATESSISFSEAAGDRICLPSRPVGDDGEALTRFLCTFCYYLTEIRNSHSWIKHVFRDLEAYICTFNDCEKQNRMFDSRSAWFAHETNTHRREWWCNETTHPPCSTRTDFEAHLRKSHSRQMSEAQVALLTDMSQRPSHSSTAACPLCTEDQYEDQNGVLRLRKPEAKETDSITDRSVLLANLTTEWRHDAVKIYLQPQNRDDLESFQGPEVQRWLLSFEESTTSLDEGAPADENLAFDSSSGVLTERISINATESEANNNGSTPAVRKGLCMEPRKLKRHLAQHMERLALFAILPSQASPDQDADAGSLNTRDALGHTRSESQSSGLGAWTSVSSGLSDDDQPMEEEIGSETLYLIEEYIRDNLCDTIVKDPRGVYYCTAKCGRGFNSLGDWIQHEERRQPQDIWVCALCRETDEQKPWITGRKDKIRAHVDTKHKDIAGSWTSQEYSEYLARSHVNYQAHFQKKCGFCGSKLPSWGFRNEHIAKHFEQKIPGGPWLIENWKDPWPEDSPPLEEGSDDDVQGKDLDSLPPDQSTAPAKLSVCPDSSSEECMNLVREWVASCVNGHKLCTQLTSSSSFVPTRLIDVGGEPRLIETGGVKREYTYLSHVWGDSPPTMTTRSTYSAFQKNIPFHSISNTLQEAIILTRKLSISWIWIDSLCIVQNDVEDWKRESSIMDDIVKNAFIVIAAAHGNDVHAGLFNIRPRGSALHYAEKPRSALSTRAWTFQEQYLARRLLSFERSELVWQCQMSTRCECQIPTYQQPRELSYEEWRDYIVPEYSQRRLAYRRDKLNALSSIAREFQSYLHDEYLAGLWRGDLLRGLLWRTAELGPRSTEYVAPSWSWASVDVPVYYNGLIGEEATISHASVLGCQIQPASGLTSMGNIDSGIISLQGALSWGILQFQDDELGIIRISDPAMATDEHFVPHFRISKKKTTLGEVPMEENLNAWSIFESFTAPGVNLISHRTGRNTVIPSEPELVQLRGRIEDILANPFIECEVSVVFDYIEDRESHNSESQLSAIYCLWLLSQSSPDSVFVHGLLLEPVNLRGINSEYQYQRLGVIKLSAGVEQTEKVMAMLNTLKKQDVTIV